MHIIDSFLRLPMPVSETAAELGGSDFVSALHDAGIKAQIDATPGTTVFVPRQMDIPEDMTPMDLIELLTYVLPFYTLVYKFSEESEVGIDTMSLIRRSYSRKSWEPR
jgi:hypothetical protein